MMPSRALRSVSLAIASRSTAPADRSSNRRTAVGPHRLQTRTGGEDSVLFFFLTLISAIVEDVESIYGLFSSLLATKDQIDPLVEVTGHVFALLEVKWGKVHENHFKLLRSR